MKVTPARPRPASDLSHSASTVRSCARMSSRSSCSASALTFISWDIQKGKATKRFEALRDGHLDYDRHRCTRGITFLIASLRSRLPQAQRARLPSECGPPDLWPGSVLQSTRKESRAPTRALRTCDHGGHPRPRRDPAACLLRIPLVQSRRDPHPPAQGSQWPDTRDVGGRRPIHRHDARTRPGPAGLDSCHLKS
jgi:hypothetical protein